MEEEMRRKVDRKMKVVEGWKRLWLGVVLCVKNIEVDRCRERRRRKGNKRIGIKGREVGFLEIKMRDKGEEGGYR
jgi:hypothetical protein